MARYAPAERPTICFIGVTTGFSSIMKVFPAWAAHLKLDAVIRGIDFPPEDAPEHYREAVRFIKEDPLSLGALVTTHKLNLLKAASALFDELDPHARTLVEVSSISKRGGRLIGHAKDPITAAAALDAIVDDGYWRRTGGALGVLGAGGASLALTLSLHQRAQAGGDVPARIVVTARRESSLEQMKRMHDDIGFTIPIDYVLTLAPQDADRVVAGLPACSVVANATGLGKDRPGSPITDAAVFPEQGIAWDFNYRGKLVFLEQARVQQAGRRLEVVDGWVYFLHGWTSVIAEVFDIDIPRSGPAFELLGRIAIDASSR